MRKTLMLWALILILTTVVLGGAAAWGQNAEEEVRGVLEALKGAIADGDADAFAGLLSDSGFVGVMPQDGPANCFSKDELVDGFKQAVGQAGGGATVLFEDVKVDTHWMVALLTAKVREESEPPDAAQLFDAILVREGQDWKICALMATEEAEGVGEDVLKAFVEQVDTLPQSLKQGDVASLEKAVNDKCFVLCFLDPGYELRWANSKTSFIQMIESVIPMVTVNESRLDVSRTVLGRDAAIVDGTWILDIPDFGQTSSAIRAYAIKVGDDWKVVAIAGGPKG